MNNKEIQAIRKLLMLEVKEAADFVGGVSARTWQYWESGKYNVPEDVAELLLGLVEKRLQMIETSEDVISEQGADQVDVAYYLKYDEYLLDHKNACVVDWRLAQSVAAYLVGENITSLK